MTAPTTGDLIGALVCFVEMWGAGYLVIAAKQALERRNQQAPAGEKQP